MVRRTPVIQNKNFRDNVALADWSEIAETIKMLPVEIKSEQPVAKRLRTKSGMVKHILEQKISQLKGERVIDGSFYVAAIKTIRKMEKEFADEKIEKGEFLIFLGLLIDRLHAQRLRIKKPHTIIAELEKMKSVIENGKSL